MRNCGKFDSDFTLSSAEEVDVCRRTESCIQWDQEGVSLVEKEIRSTQEHARYDVLSRPFQCIQLNVEHDLPTGTSSQAHVRIRGVL